MDTAFPSFCFHFSTYFDCVLFLPCLTRFPHFKHNQEGCDCFCLTTWTWADYSLPAFPGWCAVEIYPPLMRLWKQCLVVNASPMAGTEGTARALGILQSSSLNFEASGFRKGEWWRGTSWASVFFLSVCYCFQWLRTRCALLRAGWGDCGMSISPGERVQSGHSGVVCQQWGSPSVFPAFRGGGTDEVASVSVWHHGADPAPQWFPRLLPGTWGDEKGKGCWARLQRWGDWGPAAAEHGEKAVGGSPAARAWSAFHKLIFQHYHEQNFSLGPTWSLL